MPQRLRPKRPKIRELHQQLSQHNQMLSLAKEAGDEHVAAFHSQQWERLRAEIVKRYAEADAKQLSPEVEAARNARWRHCGAMGSVSWARFSLERVLDLPTATEETKELAWQGLRVIFKLQDSLKIRNNQTPTKDSTK